MSEMLNSQDGDGAADGHWVKGQDLGSSQSLRGPKTTKKNDSLDLKVIRNHFGQGHVEYLRSEKTNVVEKLQGARFLFLVKQIILVKFKIKNEQKNKLKLRKILEIRTFS